MSFVEEIHFHRATESHESSNKEISHPEICDQKSCRSSQATERIAVDYNEQEKICQSCRHGDDRIINDEAQIKCRAQHSVNV